MNTAEAVSQRESALAKANYVRTRRAALRREVRAGRQDLRELVREPPDVMSGASVYDVLQWLPRVGPMRAKRALFGVCGATVTLEVLGPHTRRRVVECIDDLDSGRPR